MLQIFILAAVALFLFWRLRAVLGSRDGFEKTLETIKDSSDIKKSPDLITENSKVLVDNDIFDYVDEDSKSAEAFKEMKEFDNDFSVNKFVSGAKKAYEIILMAFENGETEKLKPLLVKPVFQKFKSVIDNRKKKKLVIEAKFIGMRDIRIINVAYDKKTKIADVSLTFKSEINTVV
ncbi:Tim44/TimA family putative adaptor protein, partial [Paracoccaceae bacterium]|nr:Tim44/TimA family putative adaptor protein [Paracoccaceae bacterium]